MLTKEQLEIRRTGIGSSDIAAVAGVDAYRNAMHVYCEKVLPVEQQDGPAQGRAPTRWGQRLEKVIVEEWADISGVMMYERPRKTLRHPSIPIALASPDAWALDADSGLPIRLCEAKAPGWRQAEQWADDSCPEEYIVQAQWQMGVTGIKHADLCALIAGQDFRMRALTFDAEMFAQLLSIAQEFWAKHVVPRRVEGLIDGSEATAEYLRRRFPSPTSGVLKLREDDPLYLRAATLAQLARTMKASKEAAEEEEDAARNELKALIGDAEGIDGIATFKTVERSGYTVAPTTYRELRLARQKKEKKS